MMRRIVLIILVFVAAAAGIVISNPTLQQIARSFLARHLPTEQAASVRQLNAIPMSDRLAASGFALGDPVLLRIFKRENLLELWMSRNGRFELAFSYPICAWSGELGPKLREGDKQSPEGFYSVSAEQLNPRSAYYLALNLGFPNAFDRAQGRTGSFLMIHGDWLSVGCYAMTDAGIDDIYKAVSAALAAGQREVPVHVFPFRMTGENLSAQSGNKWLSFWENLAEGDKMFLETGQPPQVFACGSQYGFADARSAPLAGCVPI